MKTFITIMLLIFSHITGFTQNAWDIIKTDITESLHDIEFINDSVGFIYSYGTGNIYRSIDEGYTWTRILQTDSIYFEQIQFINSKLGWICGEKGKVLRTNDCGKTWSDLSIISKDGNLLLYGMWFINDSIGYLSGATLSEKKLKPKLYLTNNGGTSWTSICDDIPHMILNLYKKDNVLLGSGNGFIVKIGIQTNTWKYVFRDTLNIVRQIRDIQFANDKLGIGISFNGKILLTTNGGDSFIKKEITSNRLRSIAYLGEKKWIVVGDNNKNDGAVLYNTNDNGASWKKNNDFNDIHRVTLTKKYIWIVGKNGLIAKKKRI